MCTDEENVSRATLTWKDATVIAAAVVFILIVGASIIWLVMTPYQDQAKALTYKETFDVVVKGTLLPLFSALVGLRIVYTLGTQLLHSRSRENQWAEHERRPQR